ncbi:MAG: hypothetical protein GY749_29120 [Desulfobacteraceae bacterium]|nr:hypothetical protein [Desulfobacteraceae bacterium]MCP4350822.1 hypothetical protein [Desulfobacterales bacterium]
MKKPDTSRKEKLLLDFYNNTPTRRLSEIKLQKGEKGAVVSESDKKKIKVFALSSS